MKRSVFIILAIFLVMLTGCTKNYGRSDIKEYIEKNIGIKGYKLAIKPMSKEGTDGYTDYYWHVKYKDIEFDVIDDHFWGMESASNYLDDDFDQVVLDYFYEKYNNKYKITYKKDLVYGENKLICEVANEQKEINYDKLQDCYNNMVEFVRTIDFETYPMFNISVEVTNGSQHAKWLSIYHDNSIKTFDEFKNTK